jgi:gamma-glutamylcyclotransferase (GGCT)/AIG2-like uncharacterized protein YtfP
MLHFGDTTNADVADYGFFYGTLMAGFDRRRRAGIDNKMVYRGRGYITGALFDLGIYPAAIPSSDGRIWGEAYEFTDVEPVLAALDDIEGYSHSDPDRSLYLRRKVSVTLEDGRAVDAWVYFYNAPLGAAPRIDSGDYLAHIRAR